MWQTPQATSRTSTSPGPRLGELDLLDDERPAELLEHRGAHPHAADRRGSRRSGAGEQPPPRREGDEHSRGGRERSGEPERARYPPAAISAPPTAVPSEAPA